MELTLNNGFCEMSQDELIVTEGGGAGLVVGGVILFAFLVCGIKGCADADAGK